MSGPKQCGSCGGSCGGPPCKNTVRMHKPAMTNLDLLERFLRANGYRITSRTKEGIQAWTEKSPTGFPEFYSQLAWSLVGPHLEALHMAGWGIRHSRKGWKAALMDGCDYTDYHSTLLEAWAEAFIIENGEGK